MTKLLSNVIVYADAPTSLYQEHACAGIEDDWLSWHTVAQCRLLPAVAPLCLAHMARYLLASVTHCMLLAGPDTPLFCLWLVDLTVCQMFKEWVATEELSKRCCSCRFIAM